MRGTPDPQLTMLTSLSTEERILADHPIRKIRAVVEALLAELDEVFDGMYAAGGRTSVRDCRRRRLRLAAQDATSGSAFV